LATEQTGANLYSGTGSFINAVDGVGFAGSGPADRSQYVVQKEAPAPLYALAENLDKNPDQEGNTGPDDENDSGRKVDRDAENFQRLLNEIDRQFGLHSAKPAVNQIVFDSFDPFKLSHEQVLSDHAIQLAAEIFPVLQDDSKSVEIIVWATMPSPLIMNKSMSKLVAIRREVEAKFWIRQADRNRIRYTVKPWLFSDAKRPIISFVVVQH
jgi:hypothetical protein